MRYFGAVMGFGLAIWLAVVSLLIVFVSGGLTHVELSSPRVLVALVLPVLAVLLRGLVTARPATMRFSRTRTLEGLGPSLASFLRDLPDGLRLASALLIVLALARPQSTRVTEKVSHEGIDIAIAVDLSESMQANDLSPSRLEASKAVVRDFIERRPRDRISVVAFGAYASTVAPLTLDHDVLINLVGRLKLKVIDGSQTAIGAGLGVALNRLDESEAESKIIVLLTDGVHNASGVDPDSMAQEAAERNVRVYTVLMGRHGGIGDGSGLDSAQLERIASVTGGYAYTAEDTEALTTSFQDLLDKLERSEIESKPVRAELFYWLVWPALLLLLLDVGLRNTRLRRFP